jgi:tetratricopeptide (TPR) repeat protein
MHKCVASGVLLSFGLVSSSLAAAASKYTKKESDIQATQTDLTRPVSKKRDQKTRPTINADDVFQGIGEQVKGITDAQISVLQRLIENTSDTDPEKPDLLFRMAELYNEQQRYYSFRARELDQKIFEAGNRGQTEQEAKLKAQQADYQKKEDRWLLESVKKYLEVADHPENYGTYKKMDEVLFYLAYLLNQVKKEEAARKYFKRLIKDYPSSKFLPDAFLSFGEYYFEQRDLESALKFYDKVLTYPNSRVFGYARYKEGWCYYNLGDFKQALATFVSVIEMTQRGSGSSNKANRLALEKEAKKDSVRAYSRIGTPDKAWPFFQRIGGSYAMTMMEQLGELYNAQGQFQESIKVFRQLMAIDPNSAKLCVWQTEVMRNTMSYTGSKAHPDLVKELQRLAAVYDAFKDKRGLKPDAIDECKDNTANTLRELATVWHREAQKTNDNGTYDLAQYLYKEYISKFPKEKDAYIMNYYYAELLFKLGANGANQKYCDAAPIYTKVVELNPSPKAKYLKDAAYAAVISWKNCLSVDDTAEDAKAAAVDKRKEGKQAKDELNKYAEKDIPPSQRKMIAAFDTYIKYVPESDELPTIKYRKARIYYEYNHISEAIPLFKDLAENHQDSDLAMYSANLLLDCYVINKDFKDLRQEVETFLQSPKLMSREPDFKKQLTAIKANIQRQEIEYFEKDKKYADACRSYLQLASDYPNDSKIDEIYFNAAVNCEKAKLIGLAIQARQVLIRTKPDSRLAKKAVYLIGRNYQDIAAFELASENYENFAKKYPGEPDGTATDAAKALNTAAFFRRGLGQNEFAIDDTDLFVKNYGGRKEFVDQAAGVKFGVFQIFEQQKDWDKLQHHFQVYLRDWASKGGVDRQIIAHVKIGELLWRESCPVAGVNGACIEVTRTRAGGRARIAESERQASRKKKGGIAKKMHKAGADLPKQCGPETKSKITVHERKPALAKEAMTHFAAALKLWKAGAAVKGVPGKDEAERTARANEMGYFAAEARMAQGDQDYEKFLQVQIPERLDFSEPTPEMGPGRAKAQKKKVEESKKKFAEYIKAKTKSLEAAQKSYQAVILFAKTTPTAAHWAIAAAARIGQLFQDFSGQLYTAPVPKAGTAPSGLEQAEWEQLFHDAYCDQMVDYGDKFEAKAIEGLGTCLNKSTELSWFNEWSGLCEAELNQIKPNEYPLASEIRAQPGYAAVSTDRSSVQSLETK